MRFIALIALSTFLLTACNPAPAEEASEGKAVDSTSTTNTPNMVTTAVYELAVRVTKEGQLEAFEQARSNFIELLQQQEGAETDREFKSFYALPEPNKTDVFIGMTKWASIEAAGKASSQLMGTETATTFFSTFDFMAYALMQQTEGPDFDLATLAASPGRVLEVAVRRTNQGQEAAFNEMRDAFVEYLSAQPGVQESYEFEVLGSLPGLETEGLTIGMTVYESQESFQAVAGSIMQQEVTQNYFGTFDVVAAQYAMSVK